jgi:hypothetical protein
MLESMDPGLVLGSATLLSGGLIGWAFGLQRGRKQARPGLDWHEFVRENAAYDFKKVRETADEIVKLANGISIAAGRSEKNVKTLSVGEHPRPLLETPSLNQEAA